MSIPINEANIIVVEDDPSAQLITLDLLRMGGAENCYLRKSVDHAVQFAEKLPRVDIFLVDINIPGKSGYDLLAAVRTHPKLGNSKVVAVTAGTLPEDVAKATAVGFDGFISKPLRPGEFTDQVQQILDGKIVWDSR